MDAASLNRALDTRQITNATGVMMPYEKGFKNGWDTGDLN